MFVRGYICANAVMLVPMVMFEVALIRVRAVRSIVSEIAFPIIATSEELSFGIYKHLVSPPPQGVQRLSEVRLNYLGRFDREFNNELFAVTDLFHAVKQLLATQ